MSTWRCTLPWAVVGSTLLCVCDAALCADWEVHKGINILPSGLMERSPGCRLMGADAPCEASGPGLGDYLWLGQVDSVGECQWDALKQVAAPKEGQEPCISVTFFTAQETSDFQGMCYCGTTKDWKATPSVSVISARFDGAQECWGWPIVLAFFGLSTAYLVGGSVYNITVRKQQGLAALPNPEIWASLRGLVLDGARFTQSMGKATPRGEFERVPETDVAVAVAVSVAPGHSGEAVATGGAGNSKKERKAKGKKEKVHKEKGKGSKDKKRSKGGKSSQRETKGALQEALPETGPGWGGNANTLAEERQGSLHSSQQKIKVVVDR